MSRKITNRSVEEIFRDQFEDYNLDPSESLWPVIRKRLSFKEFFRFNPGRFNIFYAGAIAAAAAAVAIITLGEAKSTDEIPVNPENSIVSVQGDVSQADLLTEKRSEAPVSKGSARASSLVTTEKIKIESQEKVAVPDNRTTPETEGSKHIKPAIISDTTDPLLVNPDAGISSKLLKPSPGADFAASKLAGCMPLQVSFDNLSQNYDSCQWEFGDGGYSFETDPVWVFDEEGKYNVTLHVFGNKGEIAVHKQEIRVYGTPKAKFEVSTGDPVIPDEELMFYNYSENSTAWNWDFGDGSTSREFEPSHRYDRHDSYSVRLIAISEFGCTDTLTITDAFGANSCYLRFPNAFIPNDGGPTGGYFSSRTDIESEVFHPAWSGVTSYNLKIYSRTGVLMFESDDINVGWDGYYRGQKAEPGVYIWKVRGVFKNGEPFVKGGDVTLLPRR